MAQSKPDLISRQELLQVITDHAAKVGTAAPLQVAVLSWVKALVQAMPAVDAVLVPTRCKECASRLEGTKMCAHPRAVGWDALEPEDDDFCSFAQRRVENGIDIRG